MEHKTCKNCKWNEYPICKGTIMDDGNYMNIENLKPNFRCGQKDLLELTNFSIQEKSKLELLEKKVLEIEKKIGM